MSNEKKNLSPATLLAPIPAVLVGCGNGKEFAYNVLTVAWTGTVCSEPVQVAVAIRPERYSFGLINATGEFTVNMPTTALVKQVDYCGVRSGRDVDKFATCGLTALPGKKVSAPIIAECPLALECEVSQKLELGSHTLFIGIVQNVSVDANLISENGAFDIENAGLLAFAHGKYCELGKIIGSFGFSVRKK